VNTEKKKEKLGKRRQSLSVFYRAKRIIILVKQGDLATVRGRPQKRSIKCPTRASAGEKKRVAKNLSPQGREDPRRQTFNSLAREEI